MAGYFTYAQLTQIQTLQQAIVDLQTQLTGSGIAGITDWSAGSPEQTFLQTLANFQVQVQQYAQTLAVESIVSTADGDYLTNEASSFFNAQRFLAAPTQGLMNVFLQTTNGPYTFAPGELSVELQGAYSFQNNSTFTLNSGTPNGTFPFIATIPGASSNSPVGSVTASLLTAFPGITVVSANNPLLYNGWITSLGQDQEADSALQNRCESQWSGLAPIAAVKDRFVYMVLSASQGVLSDVFVQDNNPGGPGTVWVYVSTPTEVATPSQIQAITSSMYALLPNGPNMIEILAPQTVALGTGGINDAIQIYYSPNAVFSNIQVGVIQAITNWVAGVSTGGTTYAVGLQNIADIDDLYDLIYNVPGVRKVVIQNQSDITLGFSPVKKLTVPNLVAPLLQFTGSLS